MDSIWQQIAAGWDARLEKGKVAHFGDPAAELQAAAAGTVLCPLVHLGLIAGRGEDAGAFLQGQLSCDVREVSAAQARHAAYCTPKGRILANLLLWQRDGVYWLALSEELREPIQNRLSKFVLRAKLTLADAGAERALLGIAGLQAAQILEGALGPVVPATAMAVSQTPAASVIRLSGQRFIVAAPVAEIPQLWRALAQAARPVGTPAWEWLDIADGLPRITAATQEQFVPQMINLERIGGVSFKKGCYPGQEIIARSQYLGQVKRRLHRIHFTASAIPAIADSLFSPETGEQASGILVNVAPAPQSGYEALAVIQESVAGGGGVRYGAPGGPVVDFLPLPYPAAAAA